ncbi:MAG: insulinase family protein [Desulfovibrionaceae bacterium]|nr:insulinase family protein [Desulfovibrionaceae bacterium]
MLSHGFELLREETAQELSGTARLWRHVTTGAQLLSICNQDENKCFGVNFRTPPADSSGVAHILEHSVLCGSERFPTREPFVELLKGSLQTFLNAFTFPDKTCYPVASANLQDFYNLIDVYLDAVFHPRITEDIFRQEGWHVAAEEDVPWVYKGVVYNEMKGAYSSPETILAEQSQQAVFPDMLYSLDAGGEPENILRLGYEAFKNFHARYYHPSNARFFFWGDDPEEDRLARLARELSRFSAAPVDSHIPLQPRRDTPRLIEHAYAAGEEETRAMLTVNWLLCESASTEESLALEILEHILLGLPGSPLRRALIESGLGEDLAGVGLETDLQQLYFSVGLKGIDANTYTAVEHCIFDTLAELAKNGITPDAVEAAVNSAEFALRENNSGRFPRGLAAMVRSLSVWLYDGDPLAPLCYEAPLASVKKRLARGEKLFETLIRTWLLENSHRATVLLTPDPGLAQRREEAENARLRTVYARCTEEERKERIAGTQQLRALQAQPDSPEALAAIPSLELADLPERNTLVPLEERRIASMPFLFHDLDTSGIAYLELLLPLNAVPQRLIPLVPLFARALTEMGTQRRDFAELGMRIAAKTGGLEAHPFFSASLKHRGALTFLSVNGKATQDKLGDLFDLIQEILLQPDFDQLERFSRMLLEEKARLEHSLVPAGHGMVAARLCARYHASAWLSELCGGVTYLDAIRARAETLDADWTDCRQDLLALHGLLARSDGALLNVTCTAELATAVEPLAKTLVAGLPRHAAASSGDWRCPAMPAAEALCVPAQVNYVGMAANLFPLGYRYHGSINVILRHLRMAYLWERVRVQGGAYGVFCSFDRLSGILTLLSYRDPNIARTLDVYDGAAEYLRTLTLDKRELTRAVVGAIGDVDAYMLPDAKGAASLIRWLTGLTDELRQHMRDEILGTTLKDFHAFADVLDQMRPHAHRCALGGKHLDQYAKKQGWEIKNIL